MEKIMGTLVGLVLIFGVAGLLLGPKGCQQKVKHVKSRYIGIDRVVTLYACDGSVITNYSGRFNVESGEGASSAPRFVLDGKTIILNGTYTIVEK